MGEREQRQMPDRPSDTTINIRNETRYLARLKLEATEFEDPGNVPQATWRQMMRSRIFC